VLRRVLEHNYPDADVVYARNITDVDDKIMTAAAEQAIPIDRITTKFTEIYRQDTAALGVLKPTLEPHATEHIGEMIAMMQTLIDKGHAYAAEGHVLFNVGSFDAYGDLAHRSLDDMIAGARVEVAPYKKNPADFVLWKPSTAEQVGWDSPWGFGRPGWHLECSAMAAKHLGETIDIHGGGIDLAFPHHENERAQSMCAHGKSFARFWVHNGFLTVDATKMSKSLGNVLTIRFLLDPDQQHNDEAFELDSQDFAITKQGEVLRTLLLSAHYRQPMDWSDDAVDETRRRLNRMYRTLDSLADVDRDDSSALDAKFLAALNDDLNTPKALARLAELITRANKASDDQQRAEAKSQIVRCGYLLGILQQNTEAWIKGYSANDYTYREDMSVKRKHSPQLTERFTPGDIRTLIDERIEAKQQKDYAKADEIRANLEGRGIALEDRPDGTTDWRLKE